MSTRRTAPSAYDQDAQYRRRGKIPRGRHGRRLCRRCKKEVPKGRRTFCSDECVHEWKLRTNTSYVRRLLKKRDKGVCAICLVDTAKQAQDLWQLASAKGWGWDRTAEEARRRYRVPANRLTGSWWDADHIKPVVEGGGECGLDNYRTLCILCHHRETAKLRRRRAKRFV